MFYHTFVVEEDVDSVMTASIHSLIFLMMQTLNGLRMKRKPVRVPRNTFQRVKAYRYTRVRFTLCQRSYSILSF